MLDVIHFFFEDDMNFVSQEHAVIVQTRRKKMYEILYDMDYKYGVSDKTEQSYDYDNDDVKPYIPPTQFDASTGLDESGILDSPLN